MKIVTKSRLILVILLASFSVESIAEEAGPGLQRSTRIDFEDSRVQGQSIKAGAVYLTNRKKNEIDSMLKQRTDYRKEILNEFKFDIDNDNNTQ